MDQAAIASNLESFIREKFKVSANDPDFDMDIHLFDYGYIDSFGAVDLTTFVESTFGVEISNSDLVVYPMNTIHEIAGFVVKRRGGEI
jgi:methoxymalonate biosynthesis acyl carrier protein